MACHCYSQSEVGIEIACHHPQSTRGPSRDSLSPPSLNPSQSGVGAPIDKYSLSPPSVNPGSEPTWPVTTLSQPEVRAEIACLHLHSTRGPSQDSLLPPSVNPGSEPR
ncbi:hypothetical protein RRG08_041307 [Elysia crispata]|uniref:Uncharacterized protein n=1 Tax=Elysia crispata TaxID=231223 RepID=A0AAE0ZU91_9GAST|nr:hypothetical protein RRG08_041307 [Elysia crispata]